MEEKRQFVQVANEALQAVEASGQTPITTMRALVSNLDANTMQLKRSSLEISAIPSIIEAIEEREIKRRKQIKSVLTRINSEIRDNQEIGSVCGIFYAE